MEGDNNEKGFGYRYMIVNPEKGGVVDLYNFLVSDTRVSDRKFIECSDDGLFDDEEMLGGGGVDHRWVIFVSIIVRKLIGVLGKPMEWAGYLVEFFLNLLSHNGNLLGLFFNFIRGKVVMPKRDSETFISAIGHLDGRIDLDKSDLFVDEKGESSSGVRGIQVLIEDRALMDLSMMASKLAYENAKVVRNIVNQHWKMHFIDFYNCWNDYQKDMSTQVFILTDKPKDANLILISFRGTEPFCAEDWSTDFDYSWYEIPKLGKVHMGFLEALGLGNRADTSTFYNLLQLNNTKFTSNLDETAGPSDESERFKGKKKLFPEMVEMTAYFAVRSKLNILLEEHKNAKFMVTGHSLGGALAILFPTVLLLHDEEEIMQRLLCVHTYGQPRVGDRQLGRFMEGHLVHPVSKYLRVVYNSDLVPRLPYDNKTFLYKHFGVCLYYNSFYIEQKVDEEPNRNYFGLWYLIPDYIIAVWELFRSFIMGRVRGPEYKEGWLSVMLRIIGLVLPGISDHSPMDYVNSIRLGRIRTL